MEDSEDLLRSEGFSQGDELIIIYLCKKYAPTPLPYIMSGIMIVPIGILHGETTSKRPRHRKFKPEIAKF